jgi:uridine kinase
VTEVWFQLTSPADPEQVADIVALARDAEPRCGATVVIAIDGPSGAGKTTLAVAVGDVLGCPVVHMDDLYPGWDGLHDAVPRLIEWVLAPLSRGERARYRRFDWERNEYAEWHVVPTHHYLVVEGVGSSVGRAARHTAVAVWVDADEATRMRRGIERDGETYRPQWEHWARQEAALFAADVPAARADLTFWTSDIEPTS